MNKTLHKKLTAKYLSDYAPILMRQSDEHTQGGAPTWVNVGLHHEMNILKEAAKELLQPRPQAIANLLKLAKDL
jgi:hypothetical protein